MKEIWKPIEGYKGKYEVSNLGRIKSLCWGRVKILKKHLSKHGYVVTYLSINTLVKTIKVHRLVAQAFIPNPDNKPCVNHIDSIRTNNNVNNLEWCTWKENTRHSSKKGRMLGPRGEKSHKTKLTIKDVLDIRHQFKTNKSRKITNKLALHYNISKSSAWQIINRKTWKHV